MITKFDKYYEDLHYLDSSKGQEYPDDDIAEWIINKITNKNIFNELMSFGEKDHYIIMILGPPRCGKTLLAKSIIKDFSANEEFMKSNCFEIFDVKNANLYTMKKYVKKVNDRISLIVKGNCHIDSFRRKLLNPLTSATILYVDICVGWNLSKLYNKVHINTSKDFNERLYSDDVYDKYRGDYEKPNTEFKDSKYIEYYPKIIESKSLMLNRY